MPYFDALMDWALLEASRMQTLRAVVRQLQRARGRLQWLFGGPMQLKSPWGLATLHDLAAGRDLDMVVAYFAPMGDAPKRIGASRPRAAGRGSSSAAKSDNPPTIDAARSTYADC